MTSAPSPAYRTIPARPRPVVRATELGATSVLKEGGLILLSDAFGDIHPDRRGLGLYLHDTRILSTASLRLDGGTPTLLRPDPGGSATGIVQLTNPELRHDATRALDDAVALPRQSLGIRRSRLLRDDGLFRERIAITDYTMVTQELALELLLDVDGADIFEVRGYEREGRGELLPVIVDDARLVFRYRGLDGRELRVTVEMEPRPDELLPAAADEPASVAAHWSPALDPGGEWAVEWTAGAAWGAPAARRGTRRPDGAAPVTSRPRDDAATGSEGQAAPVGATIETDDELLNLILERARADLQLLRTPGPGPDEQFVAAGVPWFATLFGRDALLTGYAALPYEPDLARDALRVLARLQATSDDPAHDAEPGKILHELRVGEMARTGELPFRSYYGSVDATPLWLIVLSETAAWTGDTTLVDELWPAAERALGWLDDAPRDDDGFIVYRTRAEQGLRNQGWKDSSDGIRNRHGDLLEPPIALAEVQGYAADARRRMAMLARSRGDDALAAELEETATTLAERFDARFWSPDLERYAMALAPGAVGDALASNVGHCLWAGIVPQARAAQVAHDLLDPALFSGWGIRTFGSGQPGYNPLGYHTGSVWPQDSAIAAAGLKRYGFHEEASRVAWAVLDAARRTPGFHLPELFCGFSRTAIEAPVVHPVSCAPQAWAAASALLLVTTMLGLVPHADRGELEIVRPLLPSGLEKVVLRGLAVGGSSVDLLFHRWRGTTSAEVIGRTGDLRVTVHL